MPGHVILAVEAVPLGRSSPSPMAAELRNAGYDVLVSSNVSEAVGLVFVSRRIEAILINSYGEPTTGLEVAGRMRAINPRIPILVVEADPDGQPSGPDSQKSVCFAIGKLEQLWQGHGQEESHGSQSGEFSCPSGKGDIVLSIR
jgi:CheY-like chemotaxis protein